MGMGKLGVGIGKAFECLLNTRGSNSCFCSMEIQDEFEQTKPLIAEERRSQLLRLKDVIYDDENHSLAVLLKPEVVVLRVSMHCNGCARKVEKHIVKMEGVVESFKVDLERKMVIVTGDLFPFEVLQCVSKVKTAEFWEPLQY